MIGIIEIVNIPYTDEAVLNFPEIKDNKEASRMVGKTVIFTSQKNKRFKGRITGVYGRWRKQLRANFGFKLSPFALGKEVEIEK